MQGNNNTQELHLNSFIVSNKIFKALYNYLLRLNLKAPAKMHLKILFAFVICCIYLLALLTDVSVEANSFDPDQTAPTGSTLFDQVDPDPNGSKSGSTLFDQGF